MADTSTEKYTYMALLEGFTGPGWERITKSRKVHLVSSLDRVQENAICGAGVKCRKAVLGFGSQSLYFSTHSVINTHTDSELLLVRWLCVEHLLSGVANHMAEKSF